MNVQVKSTKTSDLRIALDAAIAAAKIPFHIYDASFFKGEGELEGDWTVISESHESEYAIVIETVTIKKPVPTIAGTRMVDQTVYKVYYPFFDEGDASVGLEDIWIIDFDDEKPDHTTDGIVDVCQHAVNWFLNNEIRMSIADALDAEYFQSNNFMNHPIGLD